MKAVLWFFSGIFIILLDHTLFSFWGFLALAITYTIVLHRFFFISPIYHSSIFLAGVTAGQELLGNQHFGLATAFTVLLLCIHQLFAQQFKLTSLISRFSLALIFLFLFYNLLLFSPADFISRLLPLVFLYPILVLFSYSFSISGKTPTYELL